MTNAGINKKDGVKIFGEQKKGRKAHLKDSLKNTDLENLGLVTEHGTSETTDLEVLGFLTVHGTPETPKTGATTKDTLHATKNIVTHVNDK